MWLIFDDETVFCVIPIDSIVRHGNLFGTNFQGKIITHERMMKLIFQHSSIRVSSKICSKLWRRAWNDILIHLSNFACNSLNIHFWRILTRQQGMREKEITRNNYTNKTLMTETCTNNMDYGNVNFYCGFFTIVLFLHLM